MKTTNSDVEGESDESCDKYLQDDLMNKKVKTQTFINDYKKTVSKKKISKRML